MGQFNSKKTSTFKVPPEGYHGWGFDIDGNPCMIEVDGTPSILLKSGQAVDSIIANKGVGLAVDLPTVFIQDDVYVTSDTLKKYTATDSITWGIIDLLEEQFITDTFGTYTHLYQYTNGSIRKLTSGVINVIENDSYASPVLNAAGSSGTITYADVSIDYHMLFEADTSSWIDVLQAMSAVDIGDYLKIFEDSILVYESAIVYEGMDLLSGHQAGYRLTHPIYLTSGKTYKLLFSGEVNVPYLDTSTIIEESVSYTVAPNTKFVYTDGGSVVHTLNNKSIIGLLRYSKTVRIEAKDNGSVDIIGNELKFNGEFIGAVIQSKSFISASTLTISNSSSTVYVDTDLIISITTKSSNSKLRVNFLAPFNTASTSQTGVKGQVQSNIDSVGWNNVLFGDQTENFNARNSVSVLSKWPIHGGTQIDSPGVGKVVQFKVTFAPYTNTFNVNYSKTDGMRMITVDEILE